MAAMQTKETIDDKWHMATYEHPHLVRWKSGTAPAPTGSPRVERFRLASRRILAFSPARMSSLPTADLLALDTDGLKSRLSKLRRYL